MTAPGPVAVSRLRWPETDAHIATGTRAFDTIEIPHLGGRPVEGSIPPGARRVREWPNRVGILEGGSDADEVMWRADLAPRPGVGTILTLGTEPSEPFAGLLTAFRHLVSRLAHRRGVARTARPDALCTILLTPGITQPKIAHFESLHPGWIRPVPARLGEFPGGLQILFAESAWRHPSQYACAIEELIGEDG